MTKYYSSSSYFCKKTSACFPVPGRWDWLAGVTTETLNSRHRGEQPTHHAESTDHPTRKHAFMGSLYCNEQKSTSDGWKIDGNTITTTTVL